LIGGSRTETKRNSNGSLWDWGCWEDKKTPNPSSPKEKNPITRFSIIGWLIEKGAGELCAVSYSFRGGRRVRRQRIKRWETVLDGKNPSPVFKITLS